MSTDTGHQPDPEGELKARLRAGEQVSAEDVAAASAAVTARETLARLEQEIAAERDAQAAAQDNARRQAAADEDAWTSLAPTSAAKMAESYDNAVRAVGELVGILQHRNSEVGRLTNISWPDRPSGVGCDTVIPSVEVDGEVYGRVDPGQVIVAALRAAGVNPPGGQFFLLPAGGFASDPTVVAEGRRSGSGSTR